MRNNNHANMQTTARTLIAHCFLIYACFGAMEARVLNPPTNLRIVSINEDTNSVAFAWNPPHDKSRGHTKFYLQLQLGPVTNVKFVSQHFVPFSTHNYTFNNLRAGVEYILDVFSYALDGSTEILSDTSETPRVIFYINIDECEDGTAQCQHQCIDTNSSFYCSCFDGYKIDPEDEMKRSCIDIDECESSHNCSQRHVCINTPGSYNCSCNQGYYEEGDSCIDIDECIEATDNCTEVQKCINLEGSFLCCSPGFTFDSDELSCADIDECSEATDNCTEDQICINLEGSFLCCSTGFTFDTEELSCADVNECVDGTHNCSQICINRQGSYNCSCEDGFYLGVDGLTCLDIDECSEATDNCTEVQKCINLEGSFLCCSPGFTFDSDELSCADIDECSEATDNCTEDQKCINLEGSFLCCSPGFTFDTEELSCADVNECVDGTHNCSQICINRQGSYNCSCEDGFYLGVDGLTCLEFTLGNINGLIRNLTGRDVPVYTHLEESALLIPYVLRSIQSLSFSKESKAVELYTSYDGLLKTIIDIRKSAHDFDATLSRNEDVDMITGLVNVTQILLSSDVIKTLNNNFLSNKSNESYTDTSVSKAVSLTVKLTESLATVIASTVDSNHSIVSYGSGDIFYQAILLSDKKASLDTPTATIKFLVNNLAQKDESFVLTAVSLGKIGQVLPSTKNGYEVNTEMISIQLSLENSYNVEVFKRDDDGIYPVEIYFSDVTTSSPVQCVFYNYGLDGKPLGWSTKGILTVKEGSTVSCRSSHLTSFAVLANVGGVRHDDVIEEALKYFSYIGCGLSIICLILTIIALCCFRCKGQKNGLNFVHINLSIVLLIALSLFVAASWHARTIKILCSVVAGLLHYFFLSVFTWMLCEGVMLYLMVVKVFSKLPKKLWVFLLLGYGLPIPAVIIGAAIRHAEYGSKLFGCFLSPGYGTIWAFGAPALAVIAINVVFLVMALVQLYRTQKGAESRGSSNTASIKATMKAAILLLPLMGMTWLFGFVSLDYGVDALKTLTLAFNIIFIVLNSLQGVFIFIFYVLRNEKVKPLFQKCYKIHLTKGTHTISKTNYKSSTVEMGSLGGIKSTIDYSVVENKAEQTQAVNPVSMEIESKKGYCV